MKEVCNVALSNEEVFMATQFKDFVRTLVIVSRGGGGKKMQGKKLFSYCCQNEFKVSFFF